MKVLYVEDNPANVFLVKRVARMGNHEIINYIDGDKALQKFDEIAPDLVLMDIQLAGNKNGLDVVKALRAKGVVTPIIAVTAYAMVGDKERCIKAGCDDYLAKPLPIPRLVELFKQYSESAEAAAPKPVASTVTTDADAPAKQETVAEVADATPKAEPVAATTTTTETEAPAKQETVAEATDTPEAKPVAATTTDADAPAKQESVPEPEAKTSEDDTDTIPEKDSAKLELVLEDLEDTAPMVRIADSAEEETASESPAQPETQTEKSNIIKDSETKSESPATETKAQDTSDESTTKETVTSNTQANIAESIDSAEEIPTGE